LLLIDHSGNFLWPSPKNLFRRYSPPLWKGCIPGSRVSRLFSATANPKYAILCLAMKVRVWRLVHIFLCPFVESLRLDCPASVVLRLWSVEVVTYVCLEECVFLLAHFYNPGK
jgi:hypothetical protein